MKNFLLHFKYVFSSNLVGIIISPITIFILPKLLGVEEFGHYQFYVFVCEYCGLLHFGIIDGVYLKYGGVHYDTLDKVYFRVLIKCFFTMQIIIGASLSIGGVCFSQSPEKKLLFFFVGIATALTNSKTIIQFVFQATGRIKAYALVNILDRLFFLVSILICIVFKVKSFEALVVVDLISKLAALLASLYFANDILRVKGKSKIKPIFEDMLRFSKIGLSLTFSYLASVSVIGIVRVSIENRWDIQTFGKISLTLSVSNLLMIFIRTVSMVLFPTLRRMDSDKLAFVYTTMRTGIMLPLLGMLLLYYPLRVLLSMWLPQYSDSLKYMAVLFPLCIFESKMSMLIETYMKTLRLEKKLLLVNVVTLALSFVATGITVFWLYNLDLAVMSIVALLAFRCIFAEILLSKDLKINVKKDIIFELALTAVFIFSSWTIGGITGLVIYGIAYISYLFIQRKQICSLINTIKDKLW